MTRRSFSAAAAFAVTLAAGFATIGLASVVLAGTPARAARAQGEIAPVLSAPAAPVTLARKAAAKPAGPGEPACARKIRVIYAGYGEASSAPCAR
jgi:hypothetical protein